MTLVKKKIIFRHRSLEMGGIETVLLNILNYLDYNKYEVVLLLNYSQGEFIKRVPKKVKLVAIGEDISTFSKNSLLNLVQKIKRRIKYGIFENYPRAFYKKNNLLNFDYEVAFSHYMLKDVYNSPNKKSKKIYWIHGDLRNSGFETQQNQKFVDLMQKFDQGIFVSNHGKNIVEKHWQINLKNAQVINNPVEIKRILAQIDEPVEEQYNQIDFVSVGRLFSGKGFKDLLEAHYKLIKSGYDIKTLIIGDGIQRPELEALIKKYNITDSFYLYGFARNPIKYMQKAQYFILPSYSESYPMVIAEALCLQKPVLSTNVGGVAEMIHHNVNGYLFNPGKKELFEAMKYALDNLVEFKKFSNYDSVTELREKNTLIYHQIDQLFN